jgi:hypothetical protein
MTEYFIFPKLKENKVENFQQDGRLSHYSNNGVDALNNKFPEQ